MPLSLQKPGCHCYWDYYYFISQCAQMFLASSSVQLVEVYRPCSVIIIVIFVLQIEGF